MQAGKQWRLLRPPGLPPLPRGNCQPVRLVVAVVNRKLRHSAGAVLLLVERLADRPDVLASCYKPRIWDIVYPG